MGLHLSFHSSFIFFSTLSQILPVKQLLTIRRSVLFLFVRSFAKKKRPQTFKFSELTCLVRILLSSLIIMIFLWSDFKGTPGVFVNHNLHRMCSVSHRGSFACLYLCCIHVSIDSSQTTSQKSRNCQLSSYFKIGNVFDYSFESPRIWLLLFTLSQCCCCCCLINSSIDPLSFVIKGGEIQNFYFNCAYFLQEI